MSRTSDHIKSIVNQIWHKHALNKTDICKLMEITTAALRKWEAGTATPSKASVVFLENILNSEIGTWK